MSQEKVATAVCEECKAVLPIVDENGKNNFVVVGCHGDRRQVCKACEKKFQKPRAFTRGWSS